MTGALLALILAAFLPLLPSPEAFPALIAVLLVPRRFRWLRRQLAGAALALIWVVVWGHWQM
ncbi:hypothetical protein, partial [Weissella cibaria]|uniref:hypothetical protein n=1 Tax=Weissella cibaria TaxID=137591 RepID=UPI00143F53BC